MVSDNEVRLGLVRLGIHFEEAEALAPDEAAQLLAQLEDQEDTDRDRERMYNGADLGDVDIVMGETNPNYIFE